MTAAKHAEAVARHDLAAQERLTDALAVTAQRSASLLGARHPQARAAREALLEAHEITSQVRADEERREQDHRERARRRERELARREEAERAKARHQSAANGTRTQPREPVAGDAGEATAMFTSPLLTAVSEDRTPHDRDEGLREVITRARVVLWDFDGPICRLFAGHSADRVANRLVQWLDTRRRLGLLTDEERETPDPYAVLLAVGRRHPSLDLVLELEERLTREELRAVASAMPTAYADSLIRTWTAVGARLAIATDNSPRVVGEYLESRGLMSCFFPHVYGRTQDLHLFKPNPYGLNRALNAMGAGPSKALVIGSTPADCQAALQAGIPFLGYARNARKAKELRSVGAGLVVESLEQVLRIVRSSA
nr:HAD family hydrolase [Streptomyces viridochromogenes]